MDRVGAVIVAAGLSSRMGAFKPLLEIGGMTVAERVVATLRAAGISNITFVTGKNAPRLENSLRCGGIVFLRNEMFEYTEMIDSIKIGLRYYVGKCEKILVTPVDVPLFTPETVSVLIKSAASVAIPTYCGKSGHPIVIGSEAIKGILDYEGANGMKGALAKLSLDTDYIEVSDSGILLDMDTPEDYAAITGSKYG